mmetsp:Transcript_20711/g.30368  ORF Transcript_20711/g.30368 Transcript_20711/m.30368 type:complete len:115 (+) Transcript_20711:1035-1379(+)
MVRSLVVDYFNSHRRQGYWWYSDGIGAQAFRISYERFLPGSGPCILRIIADNTGWRRFDHGSDIRNSIGPDEQLDPFYVTSLMMLVKGTEYCKAGWKIVNGFSGLWLTLIIAVN